MSAPSTSGYWSPLHLLNLNPQVPLLARRAQTSPPSYRGRIGLHIQLQLWLRSHTCVSLTSAFPNNSEGLLGIGRLLKTEKERSARSHREQLSG